MRSSGVAALVAAIASFAATATAQYTNQSAPFYLVLKTASNSSYDGVTLIPCHEGAAIEGLCLGATYNASGSNCDAVMYNFNISEATYVSNATLGQTGYLTYELEGGNFNESEPMTLTYNPTSNVAVPLFEPTEEATNVAFDTSDRLNIQGYVDDTTNPPTVDVVMGYYRWAVCSTYVGYPYTTLSWVMGNGPAENPSCVSVDVVRKFY